jgi:hypothetical protein
VVLHIGTDEAGYGPLLGPLVIAGAVYDSAGTRRRAPGGGIADSKVVFSRGGRPALARTLGPFLGVGAPVRLSSLLAACGLDGDPRGDYPWYADVVDTEATAGDPPAPFRRLVVHPVCERAFNAGCAELGGKGEVLFRETMRVVRAALAVDPTADADVVCDKHGGRNRYAGHLLAELGPSTIVTLRESAELSSYRLALGGRTVSIRFARAADGADRAAALASMAAKYVRELFMEGLNRYFAARVEGLRPTAGYYADGRRFLEDIAAVLETTPGGRTALVRDL